MTYRTTFALASLALAACSSSAQPPAPGPATASYEMAKSDAPRDLAPAVAAGDRAALSAGNDAFAVALYSQLRNLPELTGRNIVFSPISFSVALGMTSAGARGASLDAIRKTMHFTVPEERLHAAIDALSLELATRNGTLPIGADPAAEPMHLSIVNAVWGEKTTAWQRPFLDTLATSYGAGVGLVDFIGQSSQATDTINQWVSDQTQKRITDLVSGLDEHTRMVLVNALYLKSPWASPLTPIGKASFARLDGTSVDAPTLATTANLLYAETADAQVAELPIGEGKISFQIVLPKPGRFASLDAATGDGAFASPPGADGQLVALTLPKFSITIPSLDVADTLATLGLGPALAFSDDFLPMGVPRDPSERLLISSVRHEAMLGIDENGMEGAAATAVIMSGVTSISGPTPEPIPMNVNRPFFVFVRDNPTGALLFAARIADPTPAP